MKTKPKTIHVAALNAIFVFSRNIVWVHISYSIDKMKYPSPEAESQTDLWKQQNYVRNRRERKRKVRGEFIENVIMCDGFGKLHKP